MKEIDVGIHVKGIDAVAGPIVIAIVGFPHHPNIDWVYGRFVRNNEKFAWDMAPYILDAIKEMSVYQIVHSISVQELNRESSGLLISRTLDYLLGKFAAVYKVKYRKIIIFGSKIPGSFYYRCERKEIANLNYKHLYFAARVLAESKRRQTLNRLSRLFPKWTEQLTEFHGQGHRAKEYIWLWGPDPYLHRMQKVRNFASDWEMAVRNIMIKDFHGDQNRSGILRFYCYWWEWGPWWWDDHFDDPFLCSIDRARLKRVAGNLREFWGWHGIPMVDPKLGWEVGEMFTYEEVMRRLKRSGGRD